MEFEMDLLMCGGQVSFPSLFLKERLRRAGWVLHVGESLRHVRLSAQPLLSRPPCENQVHEERTTIILQKWATHEGR